MTYNCKGCGIVLSDGMFYKKQNHWCKECIKKKSIEWQENNKDKVSAHKQKLYKKSINKRKQYLENKFGEEKRKRAELRKIKSIETRAARKLLMDSPEYKLKCKIKRAAYYQTNKEKFAIRKREYHKKNANAKIAACLRTLIYIYFKKHKGKKNCKTEHIIGCSLEHFRNYISSLFMPGMTLSNHGKWHIDHKKPCKLFDLSKKEEQKKCFHYTNLQPLWSKHNLSKGSKF